MLNAEQIAAILKDRKPANNDFDGKDLWNDIVREFADKLAIPHTPRNKNTVRENFYRMCDANPAEWRI